MCAPKTKHVVILVSRDRKHALSRWVVPATSLELKQGGSSRPQCLTITSLVSYSLESERTNDQVILSSEDSQNQDFSATNRDSNALSSRTETKPTQSLFILAVDDGFTQESWREDIRALTQRLATEFLTTLRRAKALLAANLQPSFLQDP